MTNGNKSTDNRLGNEGVTTLAEGLKANSSLLKLLLNSKKQKNSYKLFHNLSS